MNPEPFDELVIPEAVHLAGAISLAPDELAPLRVCVREAFGLAKAGASSRGYQMLREGRERAQAKLDPKDPRSRVLLHHWDAVLRWYERYAPAPL